MSGPITYGDKSGQQSDLVSQPLAVRRTFGLVTINVAAGYECQVYRNNQPYKTLNAGRHRWWDWGFFFVSYTAQMVDIREQTMTQPIVGSGELVDAEGQRIPVTVRFQLTYRLTSINIWFNTVDPMKKLRLLVTNKVATEVSVLPYDPQRPWYIVLRNELEVYLQAVAAAQTGLTVLNVLIAQEPAEDARITKVYRDRFLAAEAIRQKKARAVNDGDILRVQAQAVKDAAALVGANPGDIFVVQQPGGEALIDAGVKIRAIEAASGQQLGSTTVTAQPQQPAQLPPGSYTGPNTNTNPGAYSGYTGPGASAPSGSYGYGAQAPNSQQGGYGASAGPSQARQSPPFPSGFGATPPGGYSPPSAIPMISSAIDQPRLDEERQQLKNRYSVTESFQIETRVVGGGQVNVQLLVLTITGQVYANDNSRKQVNVQCYLEPDFPRTAPRMWVTTSSGPMEYPLVAWTSSMRLTPLVIEIAEKISSGKIASDAV